MMTVNLFSKNKREASNLILFSLGKFVSIFFSSVYTFVIGLYVLKITGSGLSFATTLVLGVIPKIVIYPFAGVVADKINKKFLVVSMDILNGILFIGVFLISLLYGLSIPMIYISTLIMSVITCFFDISLEAAKPNIVTENMLMSINSICRIIDSVSSVLGSMIGGLVYALIDIRVFIMINGISFLLSGISEMFIDFNYNLIEKDNNKAKEGVNFIADIREGISYLKKDKNMFGLVKVLIILNFFIAFSISVPLPYIINNVLKLSSTEFGIIEGGFLVGMIIGAIIVKRVSDKFKYSKILIYTTFVLALGMVLIGVPTIFTYTNFINIYYLFYYCIVMFSLGIGISLIDIPLSYMMQRTIPEKYRGRVISIIISSVKVVNPIALLLSGNLISLIKVNYITTLGGILLMFFLFTTYKKREN